MARYYDPFKKTQFATALTANTATPQEPLGSIRNISDADTGAKKRYKYVQAAADTTVANGTVLCYVESSTTDLPHLVVSSDRTDTNPTMPAGVGVGAITASYYGWIQDMGYHSAVLKTSAAMTGIGTPLYVCNGSTAQDDGSCEALTVSGGTSTVIAASITKVQSCIGYTAAADTTLTVAAFLNINRY